jgi:hypothetical protein
VAYLAPFALFATHERLLVFLPPLLYLAAFQAWSSLFHHAHGCANANLRVLDHVAILLLYTYMASRALWTVVGSGWRGRVALRLACVASVALVVGFYDTIVYEQLMLTFGVITLVSGALVLGRVHVSAGAPASPAAYLRSAACASLLVAVALTAVAYDRAHSVWSDDTPYDVTHGVWHTLTAQAQFVLVYSLVTRDATALEPSQMALAMVTTVALAALRAARRDAVEVILVVFTSAALVAAGLLAAALRAARAGSAQTPPLRWERGVAEPG